eukprot:m.275476 g.275476  ORF g.275476 m.275476 type:complete len:61 (-) comp54853_c0_seq1:147-329(-)
MIAHLTFWKCGFQCTAGILCGEQLLSSPTTTHDDTFPIFISSQYLSLLDAQTPNIYLWEE